MESPVKLLLLLSAVLYVVPQSLAQTNWVTLNGKQYFGSTYNLNYTDAESNCSSRNGAFLASVLDQAETALIQNNVLQRDNFYWFGLYQNVGANGCTTECNPCSAADTTGSCSACHSCRLLFTWRDGNTMNWMNWNSGQPNQPVKCGKINADGKWYDDLCNIRMRFICKLDPTSSTSTPTTPTTTSTPAPTPVPTTTTSTPAPTPVPTTTTSTPVPTPAPSTTTSTPVPTPVPSTTTSTPVPTPVPSTTTSTTTSTPTLTSTTTPTPTPTSTPTPTLTPTPSTTTPSTSARTTPTPTPTSATNPSTSSTTDRALTAFSSSSSTETTTVTGDTTTVGLITEFLYGDRIQFGAALGIGIGTVILIGIVMLIIGLLVRKTGKSSDGDVPVLQSEAAYDPRSSYYENHSTLEKQEISTDMDNPIYQGHFGAAASEAEATGSSGIQSDDVTAQSDGVTTQNDDVTTDSHDVSELYATVDKTRKN